MKSRHEIDGRSTKALSSTISIRPACVFALNDSRHVGKRREDANLDRDLGLCFGRDRQEALPAFAATMCSKNSKNSTTTARHANQIVLARPAFFATFGMGAPRQARMQVIAHAPLDSPKLLSVSLSNHL
jgi:hypothetical protein